MQNILELSNSVRNQVLSTDRAFHSWYQFVLGYPPHLVRYYVNKFGIDSTNLVLDPFCGTGTTNVECKKLNIPNLGLEANPVVHFASRVKTNWRISSDDLKRALEDVASSAYKSLVEFGLEEDVSLFTVNGKGQLLKSEPTLSPDEYAVLPKDFISAKPLRRVLVLRKCIETVDDAKIRDALLLALANLAVNHAGNVAFGPEVYTTKPKRDIQIVDRFFMLVSGMIADLENTKDKPVLSEIVLGDAREVGRHFSFYASKVEFVITSPPYPNEKDYTRTTRLESVVLGHVTSKQGLRFVKENLLRSNSRNIFVSDNDAEFVKSFGSIKKIADAIERKRIDLSKTSGFEKLYHKIVRHYFGGMYRHFESLKSSLAPNARLAYVVGDQMSFFRTHIPTAQLLGEVAESLGYRVEEIELWRTRLATATKQQIDENVLILTKR